MIHPQLRRSLVLAWLVACCGAGCSDGDESSGGGSSVGATSGTSRSATCQEFQAAECDFISGRCNELDRAACDDTYRSLFCKDDAAVRACITAIKTAPCGTTPSACVGIGDATPAIKLCQQVSTSVCASAARCALESKESCAASLSTSLPCAQAIGALPAVDTCISELDAAPCPADKKFTLPAVCNGVIKVRTSSTSETPGWQTQASAVSGAAAAFDVR
jgi:hypothetical protein